MKTQSIEKNNMFPPHPLEGRQKYSIPRNTLFGPLNFTIIGPSPDRRVLVRSWESIHMSYGSALAPHPILMNELFDS